MTTEMPHEIWEYTPTGRSWDFRYPEEPVVPEAPKAAKGLALRWPDALVLVMLACAALWCAHGYRAQRTRAAAAAAAEGKPKFASFYNCELSVPGIQPEQLDGDPTHTLFHPYNYTVCDGVQVTLWSAVR